MTETKPSTMKPCPFCGGPGKHTYQRWARRDFHGVHCDGDCGTFFDCRAPTEGEAIEAWNTRPSSPQTPEQAK